MAVCEIGRDMADNSRYVTKMVGFVSCHYYEVFRYWITTCHLLGGWIDGDLLLFVMGVI
jgi:hypothetical protein